MNDMEEKRDNKEIRVRLHHIDRGNCTEETKTITVRIPINLYDQAKEVFDSNYVSVNTGINLALNAIASQKTLIVAQNKDQKNHD